MHVTRDFNPSQAKYLPYAANWLVIDHGDGDRFEIVGREPKSGERIFNEKRLRCSRCNTRVSIKKRGANFSLQSNFPHGEIVLGAESQKVYYDIAGQRPRRLLGLLSVRSD